MALWNRVSLAALLAVATSSSGVCRPLTFPFSVSESACAAGRLARVQRRAVAFGSGDFTTGLGLTIFWPSASGAGRFTGLVRARDLEGNGYEDFINGRSRFVEADLAFDLGFRQSASLLDPTRAPTPQATLSRRDNGSNLTVDHGVSNPSTEVGCCITEEPLCSADLGCPLLLNFDLASVPSDAVHPANPLLINSAAEAVSEFVGPFAEFLPADTGAGGGIARDGLAEPCGGALTAFDVHVFEILARTIAPSDCYSRGDSDCRARGLPRSSQNVVVFRGADPHTYRVDIYVVQYACDAADRCFRNLGPIALSAHVDWNAKGQLTSGIVTVLPECEGSQFIDCSDPLVLTPGLGMFFLPPIFPGHEEQKPEAFRGAPYLYASSNKSLRKLTTKVNWMALLKDSALNRGAFASTGESPGHTE